MSYFSYVAEEGEAELQRKRTVGAVKSKKQL